MERKSKFIPALNRRWLSPLFDSFMQIFMREKNLMREMIGHLELKPGELILDVGSGTGTLAVMLQNQQPTALVVAVDIDLEILDLARGKEVVSGISTINWLAGNSSEIPFKTHSFDYVISSFMIHHLVIDDKKTTLSEIHRLLKGKGKFLLVDFGKPHNPIMWIISMIMRNFEHTRENFKGLIPELLQNSGFTAVKELDTKNSIFGSILILEAAY